MAKKAKKRIAGSKRKVTIWRIGQLLVFPQIKNLADNDLLAQKVVEEAMRRPFKPKREKRKKKWLLVSSLLVFLAVHVGTSAVENIKVISNYDS